MHLRRMLRPSPIPRAPGVSRRLVGVGLAARFFDELLSGLPDVLMPTIREALGLSYAEVGLLRFAMDMVATVVEPVNGLLLDVWPRRIIMSFGAFGIGAALLVMGFATGLPPLLVGYGLYGLGTGPLAHTGDVLLVEAHPQAPERIFVRANVLDTIGALLAPLLVVATTSARLGWRAPLIGCGVLGLAYGAWIAGTRFPRRVPSAGEAEERLATTLRRHLREVLADRAARRWLAILLALSVSDAAYVFLTVWLADAGGMTQAQVGAYAAMSMTVTLGAIVVLDRVLTHIDGRKVLLFACLGLLALYPAWLQAPTIAWRFALGVPVAFLAALPWPLARSRALAALPGRAGTVTAIQGVYGIMPIALLMGWAGERYGLTTAFGATLIGATAAMAVLAGLAIRTEV